MRSSFSIFLKSCLLGRYLKNIMKDDIYVIYTKLKCKLQ